MQIRRLFSLNIAILASTASFLSHGAEPSWYWRAAIGYSSLEDASGSTSEVGNINGTARIDVDDGFFAGAAIGFDYLGPWSAEIVWEYRSNDSETTLADGSVFSDGNYASNIFFLNGLYQLSDVYGLKPYLGLGIGWIQEIDVDLEQDDIELSYSGDGEYGWQIFLGLEKPLTSRIDASAELRYAVFDDISLSGEEGAIGRFNSLDYNHVTLQLGLNVDL